jgi:hypothetical protein
VCSGATPSAALGGTEGGAAKPAALAATGRVVAGAEVGA